MKIEKFTGGTIARECRNCYGRQLARSDKRKCPFIQKQRMVGVGTRNDDGNKWLWLANCLTVAARQPNTCACAFFALLIKNLLVTLLCFVWAWEFTLKISVNFTNWFKWHRKASCWRNFKNYHIALNQHFCQKSVAQQIKGQEVTITNLYDNIIRI